MSVPLCCLLCPTWSRCQGLVHSSAQACEMCSLLGSVGYTPQAQWLSLTMLSARGLGTSVSVPGTSQERESCSLLLPSCKCRLITQSIEVDLSWCGNTVDTVPLHVAKIRIWYERPSWLRWAPALENEYFGFMHGIKLRQKSGCERLRLPVPLQLTSTALTHSRHFVCLPIGHGRITRSVRASRLSMRNKQTIARFLSW